MISLSFKGCRFDINSSIHHFGHSFCVQPVTRTPAPMGKYRRGWDWLPIPSLTVSLSPSNLASRKNKGVKFAIQNRRPNSLPHSIPSSQKFQKMDKQQQNQLSNYPKSPSTIFDGNDDSQRNYHCGFITHVQSATLLIGAVGSLAGSGVLASLLKANADPDQCVLAGMILCSYALLVLGWSVRIPCFYWPFLLLNPLLMLLTAIFCTYPSLDALLAPIVFPSEHQMDLSNLRPKQQLLLQITHSLRSMELVTSLCAIFLLGYFQSIVFRAHNWLRKQNKLDEQLVIIGDQTP